MTLLSPLVYFIAFQARSRAPWFTHLLYGSFQMEDHMKATFVFAVYLDELRTSWRETISEVDLINLLYDAVSEPANLKNQKGETISVKKGTASKIFHRDQGGNVNRSIRQHSHDQSVLSTIDEYFEKHVVRRLLPGSEGWIIIYRWISPLLYRSGMSSINSHKKRPLPGFWQGHSSNRCNLIMY